MSNNWIQQIVKGQPQGFTAYDPVPATLTYSINIDAGTFQFNLTDSVYPIDTASKQFSGFPSYFSYLSPPPDDNEFFFMNSGVYHVYSFEAEIGIAVPSDSLGFVSFDLLVGDSSGTGYEVRGGFTPNSDPPGDPPASTPEPSSAALFLCGLTGMLWHNRKRDRRELEHNGKR